MKYFLCHDADSPIRRHRLVLDSDDIFKLFVGAETLSTQVTRAQNKADAQQILDSYSLISGVADWLKENRIYFSDDRHLEISKFDETQYIFDQRTNIIISATFSFYTKEDALRFKLAWG
jgi:hypothetical protein